MKPRRARSQFLPDQNVSTSIVNAAYGLPKVGSLRVGYKRQRSPVLNVPAMTKTQVQKVNPARHGLHVELQDSQR